MKGEGRGKGGGRGGRTDTELTAYARSIFGAEIAFGLLEVLDRGFEPFLYAVRLYIGGHKWSEAVQRQHQHHAIFHIPHAKQSAAQQANKASKQTSETHMLDCRERDTPSSRTDMERLYPAPNLGLHVRCVGGEPCELRIVLLDGGVVRVLQRARMQDADLLRDGAVGLDLLGYLIELWVVV